MADINKNKLVNAGALQTVSQSVLTKSKKHTDDTVGQYGTVVDGNLSGQSGVRGEIQQKELALQAEIKELQDTVGGTGGTSLKDRLDAVESAIGDKATDTKDSDTIYGLIKAEADARSVADTAINNLVGTKGDASDVDTAFGRIAKEVADRTSEISRIDGLLGTKEDAAAAGGSVFAQIKQEIANRETADNALRTDLGNKDDAVNADTAFGKIAKAQAQADKGVTDAAAAQADVDALEAVVGTKKVGDTAATGIFADLDQLDKDIKAETTRATAAEEALGGRIDTEKTDRESADNALSGRIDTLEGTTHTHANKTVLDGITAEKVAAWDAAEQNAKTHAETKVNELANGAVKANTDAIAVLNGNSSVDGSVDKKIKVAIDAVTDGAPAAFDTLKEIADWIAEDKQGTAALINRVGANEAAIGVLNGADTLEGSVAKQVKDAVAAEASRADAAEKANAQAITTLRSDVVATFNDLDLEFVESNGKAAVQVILTTGDKMNGTVVTPLSAPVALPVISDDEVTSIINSLQ